MTRSCPIHLGDSVTNAAAARILDGLRTRILPKPEWTHGAHLCAATALLREVRLAAAEVEMPGLIRAYNEATGVVNSDDDGYHHTVTFFYLRVIDRYFAGRWGAGAGELATELLASPLADRAYPLNYYTKDLLFSVAARRGWIGPNLQDI